MKASFRLRKLGVSFALPVNIAIWTWFSFDVFHHKHFRLTYFIGMAFLLFLIYTTIMSYKRNEGGHLLWFAGMQCWYWAFFDYATGVFLGQFSMDTFSIVLDNAWVVHLVSIIVAVSILILFYPLSLRLHMYNKRKQKEASHSPNQNKNIGIVALIVGAVSAARHLLSALRNPTVDLLVNGTMLLFSFAVLSTMSLLCLLTYLDKEKHAEETITRIPLL